MKLAPFAVATLVVAACSSSGLGDACRAAGGQCYVGPAAATCAVQGPSGCESDPPTPGGRFCCIRFISDSGSD